MDNDRLPLVTQKISYVDRTIWPLRFVQPRSYRSAEFDALILAHFDILIWPTSTAPDGNI
jgi:hypothetical protein